MGVVGKLLFVSVTALAVFAGFVLSPLSGQVGFQAWLTEKQPRLVGLLPFLHTGIEWGYDFERLYSDATKRRMKGQTALVTGANSGTGYEISLALARLGVSVTMACRNPTKCAAAKERIEKDADVVKGGGVGRVFTETVDTSSLESVKDFSIRYLKFMTADEEHEIGDPKRYRKLNMLYLNAGVGSVGYNADGSAPLSEDGIEKLFATNYVGHHLMFRWLQPLLFDEREDNNDRKKKGVRTSRVVLTSSIASFHHYPYGVALNLPLLNSSNNCRRAYGQSKLAQILWAKEVTKRYGGFRDVRPLYVNAAHPGAVDTGIWDANPDFPGWFRTLILNPLRRHVFWTAAEGALTLLWLGVATNELQKNDVRGKLFFPQAKEVVNPASLDEELQKNLWFFSESLVKRYLPLW